jgi:hypothetical protein
MAKKTKEDYASALFDDPAPSEPPPKEERVTVSYQPTKELHRKIAMFCAEHGLKKIELYNLAHDFYMKAVEKGEIK